MTALPQPFPTPYPDVNAALQYFTAHLQASLADAFIGLYLYGSLALGDFDPAASDIDFIVVTRSELSAAQVAALRDLHRAFDRSPSPWAARLEAAYLPLAALAVPFPAQIPYPQVEKGLELFLAPVEPGWPFQRHTLRAHGLIVAGPHPAAFTAPVAPGEMRQAAQSILAGWRAQSRADEEWIAWAQLKEAQSFLVLTVCRLCFSLATGAVVSKPAAARWAMRTLDPRWTPLIQAALDSRHQAGEGTPQAYREMLAFLEEGLRG